MTDKIQKLKSLAWEVNDLQTELIQLGDMVLRETASLRSWVGCHMFGRRPPFRELSVRASALAARFTDQETRIRAFDTAGAIPHDYVAFLDLLLQFTAALKNSAVVLSDNQALALEGAEGKRWVSLKEIREGAARYDQSMSRYIEVAERLRPHMNRLFDAGT